MRKKVVESRMRKRKLNCMAWKLCPGSTTQKCPGTRVRGLEAKANIEKYHQTQMLKTANDISLHPGCRLV